MGFEELSLNAFIDEMKEASTGSYIRKFCFVIDPLLRMLNPRRAF